MEIAQIQKIIADQFADPGTARDLQKLIRAVATREHAQPSQLDLAHGSSFICNYLEQVPYLLVVAWTSARNVGLESEVHSILEMVQSYWMEDDDVIPDSLGIIGLLDDAYCSLLSMQTISDLYRMQSGKYLFPDNLTPANIIMRKIIGEPFATDLDNIVRSAIDDACISESVKSLASPEKQRLIDSQATIWNHGPVSEFPVSQLSGLGLTSD